ncbi:dienelactone hydrolase [Multifurca ochricompacta]|uniref:Dienelactone hydrolase n=1 Tax=Multifurca ochricompacta TaxID=376703 RepID=A0AAD4MDX8_9AGAM|nr:dienelactone hydrolase [Multifurca ochricompacta]
MLITKDFHDVPTKHQRSIRIFIISPKIPGYPQANEIYQVTGPVERFAGQIASQGYVVACPSSFHEFEGPEAIPYDVEGKYKVTHCRLPKFVEISSSLQVEKEVSAYDEDASLAVDLLTSCLTVTAELLAAFDPRVLSTVCFFATDIHSATLGKGGDDSLKRVQAGELTAKGELVMIFGKQDTHVPRAGRDLIRKTLEDASVPVSFLEVQAQHAFIRDESSKGRWDAALTRSLFTFMVEVFERTVGRDLGPKVEGEQGLEHVC